MNMGGEEMSDEATSGDSLRSFSDFNVVPVACIVSLGNVGVHATNPISTITSTHIIDFFTELPPYF